MLREHRRVDALREAAHLVVGEVQLAPEVGEGRDRGVGVAAAQRRGAGQADADRDEPLLGAVVKVALDPPPLAVGRGDHAGARPAQLRGLLRELLLGRQRVGQRALQAQAVLQDDQPHHRGHRRDEQRQQPRAAGPSGVASVSPVASWSTPRQTTAVQTATDPATYQVSARPVAVAVASTAGSSAASIMSGQAKVAMAAATMAMPQLAAAHHSTACGTSPRRSGQSARAITPPAQATATVTTGSTGESTQRIQLMNIRTAAVSAVATSTRISTRSRATCSSEGVMRCPARWPARLSGCARRGTGPPPSPGG